MTRQFVKFKKEERVTFQRRTTKVPFIAVDYLMLHLSHTSSLHLKHIHTHTHTAAVSMNNAANAASTCSSHVLFIIVCDVVGLRHNADFV